MSVTARSKNIGISAKKIRPLIKTFFIMKIF